MFNNNFILIDGRNGSLFKDFMKTILEKYNPDRLIVFSVEKLKQIGFEYSSRSIPEFFNVETLCQSNLISSF